MKKFLPLLLLAFFYANLSQAQCPPIFADDFESGTLLTHWSTQAASLTSTISSSNSFQGTYNLENTGNSGHYNGLKGTFTTSQPTEMSWYMKTSTLASTTGYVVVGDNATTSNAGILFCYFSGVGALRFYATGTTNFNVPVTANTWYFVEIKNINWTTKTFDVYINNVLEQAAFPFRSTGSVDVSEIHLYNLNAATVNYDDITIEGAPTGPIATAIPDTICAGETTKVTAMSTSPTDSIRWYDAASGGNILATTLSGDTITLSPTADTTLYAEIYTLSSTSTLNVSDTFSFTGAIDSFIVPTGVTAVNIQAYGAQGGNDGPAVLGGQGGFATGDLAVTASQKLYVYVGGKGTDGPGTGQNCNLPGGFNGGGATGSTCCSNAGGGAGSGGGGSDVRLSGNTLNDRVIVAAGGGGAGSSRGCHWRRLSRL